MTDVVFTRVQETLRRLKLTRMADTLDGFAQDGARAQWSYLDFLDRLLEAETLSEEDAYEAAGLAPGLQETPHSTGAGAVARGSAAGR